MDSPGPRAKRIEIAERIADSLLDCGVAQIPLRDLAARLGTSDRMLLYYFKDKTDLVGCSVGIVSTRLSALIGASFGVGKMMPAEMADRSIRLLLSDRMKPYMAVWGDLSARAARGEEPFRGIAQRTFEGWVGWIAERLAIPDTVQRDKAAAAVLVLLEGVRLVEIVRPGVAAQAVDLLIERL
jgi:AcrR family transcriptional regulator